jgi:hypothetical protein
MRGDAEETGVFEFAYVSDSTSEMKFVGPVHHRTD